MRALFIVVRLAGAALIAAAVIAQLSLSLSVWAGVGITDPATQLVNFFSFFTIDSNLLALAVFVIGAIVLITGRTVDAPWFAVVRASVTAYMTVTFIVYNTLLRGIELPQGSTVPWSNEILHVVAPLLIMIDWLLAPGRRRLEWRAIWIVIAFPLVWSIYTMIRGPLVFDAVTGKDYWYPYPFLNPFIAPEGYVSVAFYIVLIAAIIGGTGALIIKVSRMRERWPLPAA